MRLSVYSFKDVSVLDSFVVSEKVFGVVFNTALVQQVLHASLVNMKVGIKAQKTRSEVRGGGVKPWKQKSTGRARAGTIRSPLWRGGGKVFAARATKALYIKKTKINKKMRKAALRCIFSEILRLGRLLVYEDVDVDNGKTKNFLTTLAKNFNLSNGVYILDNKYNELLRQATLNLSNVHIGSVKCISIVKLLKCRFIVVSRGFLQDIERFLQCNV